MTMLDCLCNFLRLYNYFRSGVFFFFKWHAWYDVYNRLSNTPAIKGKKQEKEPARR